ncbi:restriction endonuclease subunit S [Aeromonas hydrophila]|uniref:restriction endonuclease subunit S n=1 Tax=Aeromonas hydrophila TaxID=644 RepID=UPI0020B2F6A0|nr:restriction endonuclease subunit S [Aeromonas hydrophila]HDZ8830197.1 restriction endonuclease subunit S [Aeromonas dhakensis]MCP3287239.1 restriction endonuclease subunit S [Aeromonas hydrophila]WEF02008.1 restriction endonuclease subunit S [Aeromonas hydrophila]HDX8611615.1 restriction endonuclease subunit S [Aeromonas hydrophila]HDZ8924269.1 restriction endonuclease subunit S [Aeromonas hydrophila]
MRENDEHPQVPRLRFSGFDKPWSNAPLSKALVEHKLKNTNRRDVFSVSMESGVVNQIEHLGRSYAASDTAHYNLGRCFDLVYTKSPLKAFPFGIVKQCKFDGEVALSPLYGVFTPTNPHVGLMVEAYFESPHRSIAFLSPLCQKGAKNTIQITNSTFLSGRLPLPVDPAEQQKIAGCLSSLDELIAAETRKLGVLKVRKKGLMQQLFPRKDETVPRLRFPEFVKAEDWKEARLEDLSKRGSGHTPSKAHPEYYDGEIKWVSLADSKRLDSGLIEETDVKISEAGIQNSSAVLHPAGSVLLSRDAGVGKSAVMGSPMAVSQHFIVWTCKPDRLSNWFLYYTLQLNKAVFERVATGSTIKTIGLPFFIDFRLKVPSLAEQEMIAGCLTSLDSRIAAQVQLLEKLKAHKNGLTQQLFPVPDEVSA